MSILGHDQFSAVAKRNFVLRAKLISEAVALNAQARLQRILWVVDTGVIHAAVARAGSHPELGKLLDEEYVLPALRNGVGDGAADHPAANNQNVGLVHEFRISKTEIGK